MTAHEATLHDGLSARATRVSVTAAGGSAMIVGPGVITNVAVADLRRGARLGVGLTLHRTDLPDWRLVLDAVGAGDWPLELAPVGQLSARARTLYAGAALTIAASLAGLWVFGDAMLAALAPLVPHRVTEPIGRGVVAQLGKPCTARAGNMALARLTARMKPARGFVEPVQVSVVESGIVNALALPGGHVVLFRGLIDKAGSADELAGVLAHEFAHVELRHPAKALIRQMGVSLLAQGIGGSTGGVVDLALLLQGTRAAEAAADEGAIVALRRAGISPAPMADFFDRQERKAKASGTPAVLDRIGDFAATHPADAARAARFRRSRLAGAGPALSAADWGALRAICKR